MRRRTQAELDELVRQAGFEKLSMEIDAWGIFTVSIARRMESTDQEFAIIIINLDLPCQPLP